VARVELGAQDYTENAYFSGNPTVGIGIFQLPGSNALSTRAGGARGTRRCVEKASRPA